MAKSKTMVFLSSANWELQASRVGGGIASASLQAIDVHTAPFGQYRLLLADPQSDLRRSNFDFYVFCERFEDFMLPLEIFDGSQAALIEQQFSQYLGVIRLARQQLPGHFLIHDLAPVRPTVSTVTALTAQTEGVITLVRRLNDRLNELVAQLSDTTIVPVSSIVGDIGRHAAEPGKYWLAGRAPFGTAFFAPYAQLVGGILLALAGRTARAIALDLDNTLWGGVIGDDGIEGIRCGSDFPDNRFVLVQQVMRALKRRGIVLTILSKNTDAVALEAIKNHPGMILRESDFVGRVICWDPKPQGLISLARELDLGQASFFVVDDNSLERSEFRRMAPEAYVPELPNDVGEWPRVLLSHPALTALDLTREDMARARSYEIRRDIRDIEGRAESKEEFLQSLGMTLAVKPVDPGSLRRTLQIFAKTNQYNTTTRRYSESELRRLIEAGQDVLTIRVTDKFGSDEIIGAAVVLHGGPNSTSNIDNFVMSCRVLGRGVETGAISIIADRATKRGAQKLRGEIVVTSRNEPCRRLYPDHGFVEKSPGIYELDLQNRGVPPPPWFRLA